MTGMQGNWKVQITYYTYKSYSIVKFQCFLSYVKLIDNNYPQINLYFSPYTPCLLDGLLHLGGNSGIFRQCKMLVAPT